MFLCEIDFSVSANNHIIIVQVKCYFLIMCYVCVQYTSEIHYSFTHISINAICCYKLNIILFVTILHINPNIVPKIAYLIVHTTFLVGHWIILTQIYTKNLDWGATLGCCYFQTPGRDSAFLLNGQWADLIVSLFWV